MPVPQHGAAAPSCSAVGMVFTRAFQGGAGQSALAQSPQQSDVPPATPQPQPGSFLQPQNGVGLQKEGNKHGTASVWALSF